MNNKNADKPAMPLQIKGHGNDTFSMPILSKYMGVTKREYFAAMAMQGLLAQNGYDRFDSLAIDAVRQADALLEELEK